MRTKKVGNLTKKNDYRVAYMATIILFCQQGEF